MTEFKGFTEPNTTPTPNEFFDSILAEIDNMAELKCVLYVIRRTYGFLKFVDRIAHSQFENGIVTSDGKRLDKGTGLSGPSITTGLNKAIEHDYLSRYVVCPSCNQEVTERSVLQYCMTPRTSNEEITITKNVAPAKCPYCQNELRGKEQIYYSLNFLDSPGLDYLRSLHGVYKDFKLGLSKLFTIQEKEFTRNSKEEKEEMISFEDLEGHPNSIKNKPEVSSTKGHRPSVADPSKDPPDVEELARQLATPIDLVWDYDKATNKALLHAARELFRQCKQGSIDDILDALDDYLDPAKGNAKWVKENIDSPMGLVTLVARQYQKRQAQVQRSAGARTEWQEASDRTQKALAERDPAPDRDPWWDQVLEELSLQMPKPMFDTYLKHTTLLAREGPLVTVGVQTQYALDWIEHRLAPIIERALAGYGVKCVQFEVIIQERRKDRE